MGAHKKPETTELCILEGCGRVQYMRGLCVSDYTAARNMVSKGRTTWERLEETGMALPSLHSRGTTSFRAKFADLVKSGVDMSGKSAQEDASVQEDVSAQAALVPAKRGRKPKAPPIDSLVNQE